MRKLKNGMWQSKHVNAVNFDRKPLVSLHTIDGDTYTLDEARTVVARAAAALDVLAALTTSGE